MIAPISDHKKLAQVRDVYDALLLKMRAIMLPMKEPTIPITILAMMPSSLCIRRVARKPIKPPRIINIIILILPTPSLKLKSYLSKLSLGLMETCCHEVFYSKSLFKSCLRC